MAGTREKLEDIVSKLRHVEVLQEQAMTIVEAVRQIGVIQNAVYFDAIAIPRWSCPRRFQMRLCPAKSLSHLRL